jgi:magnesium-protoporphyrin O-methyltransferase
VDGCGCDGYASPIDDGTAQDDRARYREAGPDRTTRMLLDMIAAEMTHGMSVLDIGGGIGVIDLELLKAGANRAVLVEASPGYLEAARDQAREAGLSDRIAVVAGDFVHHAAEIDAADIVTLDRVVCCYPDADALVSASAAKATRLYGLVLPRDGWYVRVAVWLDNLRYRVKRRAYRAHAHDNARIDAMALASGLRPRTEAFTLAWRVVLYSREGTDAGRV